MNPRTGKKRSRIVHLTLWLVASVVAGGILAGWLTWGRGDGAVADPMPDFASLEPADTPNRYLVLPPGFDAAAKPDAPGPVFDVPVARLERLALEVIRGQPRVAVIAAEPRRRKYAFVQRTPVMRFPDTVTLRFIGLGEARSSLAIYSRSKYGRSDFGENRRRVEEWLAAIAARVRE